MKFCPRGFSWLTSPFQSLFSCFLVFSLNFCQVLGLKCAVCRKISYKGIGPQQSEMDNLRVTFNLPRPYCRYLEEIVCDRDQDVCVTATTNMKKNGYWVWMGCDKKEKYPPPNQKGCDRLKSDSRTVTFDKQASGRRRINDDRVVSEVCICDTNYCNIGTSINGPQQIQSVLSCLFFNFLLIWYFHTRIRQ